MTSRRWDDDERLLQDLAEALGTAGGLAEGIRQLGDGAFAWHGVDEELELASLVYDSSLDSTLVVRGEPAQAQRTVLFESSAVSVQVEKLGELLVGQVIPPDRGTISLVSAGGDVIEVDVDELGCFSIEALPVEPVRLRWRTPAASLVTDWVRL
jgi:hypothetical protein